MLQLLREVATRHGDTEAICAITGEMALRMNLPDVALQAFRRARFHNDANPDYWALEAQAYELLEQPDEAFRLLRAGAERFPEHAPIWAALGIAYSRDERNFDVAHRCLKRAISLAPTVPDFHYKLALMFYLRPEAEPHYQEAIRLAPENSEMRLGYALYLLRHCRVDEALPFYEARLDPSLGYKRAARYSHGIPAWTGEDLAGKSIFVYAEQGIGDEVFFSFFLPRLVAAGARLHIGCDPRLVQLYERNFPGSSAYAFEDRRDFRIRDRDFPTLRDWLAVPGNAIDYSVAIGSIPYKLGLSLPEVRGTTGKIFTPDERLCADFQKEIRNGSRRRIAISWRSGANSGPRRSYYQSAAYVKTLCQMIDADFYVLQYSVTAEERSSLDGIDNLHFFDRIDLKQDIDANIAILSMMNVSIGPPTATQMFAVASGTPVFIVNNGPPWTAFGDQLRSPMYPEGSCFINWRYSSHYDYQQLIAAIQAALGSMRV